MFRKTALVICVGMVVYLVCACAHQAPQPTTNTTVANTTATPETTATQPPAPPAWKTEYLDFLAEKNGEYAVFALVYVDADDIPELYLGGCSDAVGDRLCSFQNGSLKHLYIRRAQGGQYVPRSGLVLNYNGTTGYYYTEVFGLTENGFDCRWSGLEKHGSGHNGFNEYYGAATYYIGDVPVGKAEYEAAIREQIDMEQVMPFHENGVSHEEICRQIVAFE